MLSNQVVGNPLNLDPEPTDPSATILWPVVGRENEPTE